MTSGRRGRDVVHGFSDACVDVLGNDAEYHALAEYDAARLAVRHDHHRSAIVARGKVGQPTLGSLGAPLRGKWPDCGAKRHNVAVLELEDGRLAGLRRVRGSRRQREAGEQRQGQ
jgi:hypothetical protein